MAMRNIEVVNTNKACCSIPPIQSYYEPQGSYISYAGFDRVYVTGPNTSDTAIVAVYDIFGCVYDQSPSRFLP